MNRTALRALVLTALVALPLGGCDDGTGPMDVYNIAPRHGQTSGEQSIRITGTGFREDIGYVVYFGSERATQVMIESTNSLIVVTPQHEQGQVDVVVASGAGPAFRIHEGFNFDDTGGTVGSHTGTGAGEHY
jgi:hypothetical protein